MKKIELINGCIDDYEDIIDDLGLEMICTEDMDIVTNDIDAYLLADAIGDSCDIIITDYIY